MVECSIDIDAVFSSLADPTRRDILSRVSHQSQTVGELADAHKQLSFAAVAKHISVLEDAKLVIKKRDGRYQIISVNPKALKEADKVLKQYQAIWEVRFNALEKLLQEQ